MMQVSPYLTFNGNCREAMQFYQRCLGGELSFQTIGESPLSEKIPSVMKNAILHASLSNDALTLLASDMVSESGLQKGNAVSIMLDLKDETDLKLVYEKLSEEGRQDHPLENTFFGALLGDLTDKYGIHWLLHCKAK